MITLISKIKIIIILSFFKNFVVFNDVFEYLKNFSVVKAILWLQLGFLIRKTYFYLTKYISILINIGYVIWINLATLYRKQRKGEFKVIAVLLSGGELLEIWLLDNHLLDTFGRKSIAQHKIYQLLESGWARINWIWAVDTSF